MLNPIKVQYDNFLKAKKLKSSKRRDFIFDFVVQKNGHFTIDDLYRQILAIDPLIGIATIYRTARLLVESGILTEHTFGEKKGFFELTRHQFTNHGHLVCLKCGKIIEFQCNVIDDYQVRLEKKHRFKINSHKFEIYGTCPDCLKK
jgi:Fur family ferric uptake transcriptional regulator